MRFDDRLETILVMPASDPAARTAAWCQIADLVAQAGGAASPELLEQAFARLREWRRGVPAQQRPGRDLVAFFADDEAAIAAPVLSAAMLGEADWLSLIPAFPPASRALLRERRDLPPPVARLLASYGQSDFALPGNVAAEAAQQTGGEGHIQIRDLVARIEAYRNARQQPEPPPVQRRAEAFRFEARDSGEIVRVEGIAATGIVGMSLADLAPPAQPGIDGQAAGAFRQRAPFFNAHMNVAGTGEAAGEWIVSGKPVFNPDDGRFLGYRGVGRRPGYGTSTRGGHLLDDGLGSDSVRQLVHELRTPLNAIRGFSDMIGAQILGPVSFEYRRRADDISKDAARLAAIFDDLETAARLDSHAYVIDNSGESDAGELIRRLANEARTYLDDREILLRMTVPTSLPKAAIGPADLDRLVSRLFFAVLGTAGRGETVSLSIAHDNGSLLLEIDRPSSLRGRDAAALRHSMIAADGENPDAPALGFGFSIRLVETLAASLGGDLVIGDGRFGLLLPAVRVSADAVKETC